MLAPNIKKKVDELWNRFWAAGITNPLVAVEQITYLIFLRRLEIIDANRANAAEKAGKRYVSIYEKRETDPPEWQTDKCKWSYIREEKTDVKNLIDNVFPWLRSIEGRLSDETGSDELSSLHNRMADAYCQLDPNKGKVLSDTIDAINQLFARAGEGSAAQDIMGDTFEYLLSEVATAGKNGQFRTPRHLIRFMVELLDPEPGQRIIDPAAGTGGFLFSAQQYLMRKYTAPDTLRLEWDGTPHRTDGVEAQYLFKEVIKDGNRIKRTYWEMMHDGSYFVGLDNDRTMARIGWMNLVLHDVNDPHLYQADSLSKRDPSKRSTELLTPESYDFVLANPPFTGTVDSNDLEKDSKLFPRAAENGKKKDDALTNKSELLFLWLMLDLLQVGGRCAVIIPEGVLFGNTDAHVRLRRELLTEHVVEGVISLPGGVFQPYTGVKTSILIFRKETRRDDKQILNGSITPRTEHVWFYEIEEDGYSRNAKRNEQPGQRNDLWDALEKFKSWSSQGRSGAQQNEKVLLQPSIHAERWRQAKLMEVVNGSEELTAAGQAFAALPDTSMWDGQVWGIHELFTELPSNPKEAELQVLARSKALLDNSLQTLYTPAATKALLEIGGKPSMQQDRVAIAKKHLDKAVTDIRKAVNACKQLFENPDEANGWRIFQIATEEARRRAYDRCVDSLDHEKATQGGHGPDLLEIAREFAKLDGFDVTLRSLAIDQVSELKAAKHWVVPVRAWALNDEWQSADGQLIGSHDANGLVRNAYVEAMLAAGLYDDKSALKDGLLDPDCIEGRDWNLSAGQYKPFDFTQLKSNESVSQLIGELKSTEQHIISGLDKLLAMVEGRE